MALRGVVVTSLFKLKKAIDSVVSRMACLRKSSCLSLEEMSDYLMTLDFCCSERKPNITLIRFNRELDVWEVQILRLRGGSDWRTERIIPFPLVDRKGPERYEPHLACPDDIENHSAYLECVRGSLDGFNERLDALIDEMKELRDSNRLCGDQMLDYLESLDLDPHSLRRLATRFLDLQREVELWRDAVKDMKEGASRGQYKWYPFRMAERSDAVRMMLEVHESNWTGAHKMIVPFIDGMGKTFFGVNYRSELHTVNTSSFSKEMLTCLAHAAPIIIDYFPENMGGTLTDADDMETTVKRVLEQLRGRKSWLPLTFEQVVLDLKQRWRRPLCIYFDDLTNACKTENSLRKFVETIVVPLLKHRGIFVLVSGGGTFHQYRGRRTDDWIGDV